jgi:outer membrane protein assembly factor BamB
MRLSIFFTLLFINFCDINPAGADDWPQWRGPDRDGTWNESGICDSFPQEGPKKLWSVEIGAGYTSPTVADDRVYVMDRITTPSQKERVHCFDSKTGISLWKHEYDCPYAGIGYQAGPRAAVAINDDRAYSLGAMGNLYCLDAGVGTVLWSKDLNAVYSISETRRMPIWGISGSPFIYEDLVIIHLGGANGACIVAFDKENGEEKWRALDDRAQYTTPILIKQNGRDVLVCWTGDSVAGINPEDGSVHWRFPFKPKNMPIGIATPLFHDNKLFVTSFYDGSLMLNVDPNSMNVSKAWSACGENEQQTEALHSIISTPIWLDDHIYGVDSYGEFRCINADTGERIWEDATATPKARWSTIHFVKNGDRIWMFNERGELIISTLSPGGFKEIDRAKILEPTTDQLRQRGGVCWSHPAFADRCIFARNDKALVCFDLEE